MGGRTAGAWEGSCLTGQPRVNLSAAAGRNVRGEHSEKQGRGGGDG